MTQVAVTVTERSHWRNLLQDIAIGASEREHDDVNPHQQVRQVIDSGFGAARLPQELGGEGLTVRALFERIIDLAEADPIVAHILRAHFLCVEDLLTLDSPVAQQLLAEVRAGKIIGNASSERGSTAAGDSAFATTISTDNGVRLLNGQKYYTTGTLFADYVGVWASEEGGVTSAVIPLTRPGVQVIDDWDGFGQRRTGSGTTRFDRVQVSDADVLRHLPAGEIPPRTVAGPFAQLYLLALIAGILRSAVTDVTELVRGRSRGFAHASASAPADDESVQEVIGELASLAFVAESAVLIAAESIDAAIDSTHDGVADQGLVRHASLAVSKAKVVLDELGTRGATLLFEAAGASAASRAKNLDRHWRNIRTLTLHNPRRLKARAVGHHRLHGGDLPANWYF